jgi:hypothetical protein
MVMVKGLSKTGNVGGIWPIKTIILSFLHPQKKSSFFTRTP